MENVFSFLMELDKLKSVNRRSYIFDQTRNENSAEHSWHLALGILTLKEEFDIEIDIVKTIKMALVHDICEIGAGDISIFDPERSKKEAEERTYINQLSVAPLKFASEIKLLWEEYEEQSTKESRWVRVVDRLLPFMMNLNTDGRTWKEQGIKKSQVIQINEVIKLEAPEIYDWMLDQIQRAVNKKWLINS
ncbi:MAG: putative hydrolase of HD superfamily [Urechidicola sp.]|jgi:putative hydrolase of HD superfamily